MSGPLAGVKVVELAGIGPGPFCGMVLADHGADIVVIDRPGPGALPIPEMARRGRRSVVIDLKTERGRDLALGLISGADAVIEGYRPGVAERLGLGPEPCMAANRRLVYGRMTGWGQEGPLRDRAGHDIDYIALAGALGAIGRDKPTPPLNLIGDYGGGGLLLAFGVVAALLEARSTGEGRVVDAAMVDGAALLMAPVYELAGAGLWPGGRGANLLDGGAPFYDTYETADGLFMAVGALEPQFFAELIDRMGLDHEDVPDQYQVSGWPKMRELFAARFAEETRDEWVRRFEGSDACVAPVMSMSEAPDHPHNRQRSVFLEVGGILVPGPAPRFSGVARQAPSPAPKHGEHTEQVLTELGLTPLEISTLRSSGVVR